MSHHDDPRSPTSNSSDILLVAEAAAKAFGPKLTYLSGGMMAFVFGSTLFFSITREGWEFWLVVSALSFLIGMLVAVEFRSGLFLLIFYLFFRRAGFTPFSLIRWIGWPGIFLVSLGLLLGSLFPGPVTGALLPIGLVLLWFAQSLFRMEERLQRILEPG